MTATSRPAALRSAARLSLVTARLVEGTVVVLLLSAAHELWSAWQNAGVDGFLGRGPVLLDRVWSVVHNQSRGPVALVVSAVLLAGCLGLARWAGEQRGTTTGSAPGWASVRLEVVVLAAAGLALALANLVVVVVAAVVHYGPDLGPSPLVPGEDSLTTLLPLAAWPLAGALVYAALGCLWWLLRPEPSDEPAVVVATGPAPGAVATVGDEPVEAQVGEPPAEEAVRRLSPDGSTTNGYEEYFRRS